MQATAALQSYCQQELSSIHSKVQVAQPLETLDMSLQTPTYQALLARELVSSVRLRAMGDYKLGWLKGVARPPSEQVNAPPRFWLVHVLHLRFNSTPMRHTIRPASCF